MLKWEAKRMQFLRKEQQPLRANNYQNIRDSVVGNDDDPTDVGQQIIVPAAHYSSGSSCKMPWLM